MSETAVPEETRRPVLYLVVCGAPPAADAHVLVEQAQGAGWEVIVIASPGGAELVDADKLTQLTGRPLRSQHPDPGEPDLLPHPDAIVVAPATFGMINRWAQGITDTVADTVACQYLGLDLPIVAAPHVNPALARHPAFRASLHRLYEWGVRILFQPAAPPPHWMAPWARIFREVESLIPEPVADR